MIKSTPFSCLIVHPEQITRPLISVIVIGRRALEVPLEMSEVIYPCKNFSVSGPTIEIIDASFQVYRL